MSDDVRRKLVAVLRDLVWHTREQLLAIIPNALELTRRLRELREEKHGKYTIDFDKPRGYRMVKDKFDADMVANNLIVRGARSRLGDC